MRVVACAWLALLLTVTGFGQLFDPAAKFEIADVHSSVRVPNQPLKYINVTPPTDGRYEIHNATMVDLIRVAYGFDADKVLGGPPWLEMDRFDIVAKLPAGVPRNQPNGPPSPELQSMLQSLLADRFHLVVRRETRPVPVYVLTAGKKPQLKEANGTGDTGCKAQSAPAGGADGPRLIMNGTPIAIGPGGTIQYNCRNMTMEAFAAGLRSLYGTQIGPNQVQDRTGLKGAWNFDIHWSLDMVFMASDTGDRVTVAEAIDKQLGLKLEQQPVPTPVIVVESVEQKPTANQPGVDAALAFHPPEEFEVAEVKPAEPDSRGFRTQIQPGGRYTAEGMPMQFLLSNAFNAVSSEQIVGAPAWVNTARFSITAKTPAGVSLDPNTLAPLLRRLLEERFQLKTHVEDRPMTAYSLVSAKPKMKKADPTTRASCKSLNAPPGSAPGTQVMSCQNVTMAQFGDQLQNRGPGLFWPVLDATGLEGGWDFTLTYNRLAGVNLNAPVRVGDAGAAGGAPVAADPGGGLSIFEAVEKQLGLKLEAQKRQLPVIVIDHIEEKPTEN
jgi:uncharacterized protein (TIGR03435 family)